MRNTKVCIIGLGYIGLPTAALLASSGFQVYGVDVCPAVRESVSKGKPHIVEFGLDQLVSNVVSEGKLIVSDVPVSADIYLITVPTPFTTDYEPDLSYIHQATQSISSVMSEGALVILESTSPVGTSEKVLMWLRAQRPDIKNIYVAYCPERVIPGAVLKELVENDRVVGGTTPTATEKAVNFYQQFVRGQVIPTSSNTAEMCKLSENAFRDVNIAFANELSLICDKHDINVWELIKLANHHPRVNILQPGPGVGGHCIAVDPWFIVSSAREEAKLIRQARLTNDAKPAWVVNKVKSLAKQYDNNPLIACLGLSYKANIDDFRESPAVQVTSQLIKAEIGDVIACEPHVACLDWVRLESLEYILLHADIIVILTAHDQFKSVDWSVVSDSTEIFDLSGMLLNSHEIGCKTV